jgi:hypothetical protein
MFSAAPIYYVRPAFTKKIPAPKNFPDLNYDDFSMPAYAHAHASANANATKQRSSNATNASNQTSNWVLLPATWGPTSQVELGPLEAKDESGEAKNSRRGLWVLLKPALQKHA